MIDLKKFCDPTHARREMSAPFSVGAYTYATEGHICVRVPLVEGYGAPGLNRFTIDIDRLLNRNSERHLIPLPQLPQGPNYYECYACIGGKRPTCNTCHGTGEVECNLGHEHPCPDCCGNSAPGGICQTCDGTARLLKKQPVKIGKQVLDANFLRLIADLPDIQVSLTEEGMEAIYFRFTGGDGMLMGMSGVNDDDLVVLV